MTVTETPPVTDTVAATNRDDDAPDPLSGVAAVIATGQHKTIGRLYLFTALVFAIAALVLGVLVAFEQVDTSGVDIFGGAEAYVQMVILFRFSMVFMVVVPLFIGLATYITPLQVGAPSVAFPRAAAAAYWTWLVSSGIFVGAFLADGGFIAGGDAESVELALLAFGGLIASLLVATTTV
ncbi:MAG: cbb3-type cytochrome c oxidase subunit I, partial [Acidimicrobiia bacterium]|nr:cbb3-type cytochrome c oxidase subunit I [Acidimicrobiia bacterium]